MESAWIMAAEADTFSGSQDILFPEDAPSHHNSSENIFYAPPNNSSYSLHQHDVNRKYSPEELFQPAYDYSMQENQCRISPRMDRSRRRSLQSAPVRDGSSIREIDPPRLTLTPLSANLDGPCSPVPSIGFRVSPNVEDHGHSPQFKNSQRYDSRASSRSSWSSRPSEPPELDVRPRTDLSEQSKDTDLPMYHAIPEQEIYTALNTKVAPQADFRPARRAPPNWCKVYLDRPKDASGQESGLFASRRKTWSPPACSHALSCVNNLTAIRCYRSNEHLDCKEDMCPMNGEHEVLYEDLDTAVAPPQITPVSGILNKNSQKLLIKPVAFKPVMTQSSNRFSSLSPIQYSSTLPSSLTSTRRTLDLKLVGHCHDDGYASQEYSSGSHSHSTSNTSSQNSSYHVSEGDRSMSHPSENKSLDRSGSGASSSIGRLSTSHNEGHHQTPSPSDSGLGELETIIREKEAEIQHLRETMEHNETVIFQVYEEKRQNWAMQLKEVVSEWERRLHHHQEKSSKMEQTLLLQLFKLQQDRKSLRLDVEQLKTEQSQLLSKCNDQEAENKSLMRRLEDQQWETAQKAGEVSLLKAQLKEAKEMAVSKDNDLLCIKTQLKDFSGTKSEQEKETQHLKEEVKRLTEDNLTSRSELEKLRRLMSRPKSDRLIQTEESRLGTHGAVLSQVANVNANPVCAGEKDADSLAGELAQAKMQLLGLQERYEQDKEQWLVEKNKVINYQKHLQLNYVQMFRKNKMLELEMEQLMVELENKDLNLTEKLESDTPDGFESTC